MSFSKEAMEAFAARKERAIESLRAKYGRNKNKLVGALNGAEAGAVAYAFGVANARLGNDDREITLGGVVPLDFAVGLLVHASVYFGMEDKYASHVQAVGTGAITACAYRHGARLGEAMAVDAGVRKAPLALGAGAPASQLGGQRVFASPNGQQFTVTQHGG